MGYGLAKMHHFSLDSIKKQLNTTNMLAVNVILFYFISKIS